MDDYLANVRLYLECHGVRELTQVGPCFADVGAEFAMPRGPATVVVEVDGTQHRRDVNIVGCVGRRLLFDDTLTRIEPDDGSGDG